MCDRAEDVRGVAVGFMLLALETSDLQDNGGDLRESEHQDHVNHDMDLLLDGMCSEHQGQVIAYISGLAGVVVRRHLGEYAESWLRDIAVGGST